MKTSVGNHKVENQMEFILFGYGFGFNKDRCIRNLSKWKTYNSKYWLEGLFCGGSFIKYIMQWWDGTGSRKL